MNFVRNGGAYNPQRWDWQKFIFCNMVAVVIFATFFWDPVGSFWQWVDEIAFIFLNGTVAASGVWSKISAYTNSKIYDKLSTLLLIGMMLTYVLFGWGEDMTKRLAAVIFLGLYMLIFTFFRREFGFMEYGRQSPSYVETLPFHNLREMYPEYTPKVYSGNSFPSDHGIAVIIFVTMFWLYAGWKWGLASLLISPLFLFPRMIAGAHWLSDLTIGSLAYSLFILSFVLFTPVGNWCCYKIYSGLCRIRALFIRRLVT